jgi:multiple sugar transport system substrate-binding protein
MAKSSGNFPALLEAGQTPQFQQDENMRVFMEQMETAQPRPRIASWLKINDEVVAKALAQALLGEMSAEEALTLADQKANMILQRDR